MNIQNPGQHYSIKTKINDLGKIAENNFEDPRNLNSFTAKQDSPAIDTLQDQVVALQDVVQQLVNYIGSLNIERVGVPEINVQEAALL